MIEIDSITLEINPSWLAGIRRRQKVALEKTGAALIGDLRTSQTVPFETGTLQNILTFVDTAELEKDRIALVSSGPYAARLYFHPEYNFRTDKNPNAGAHWFDVYMPGHSKSGLFGEYFAYFMGRGQ